MICNRTVTTSTYDAANELLVQATGSTRVTYQYDNNGNQTQLNNEGIFTYYNWDVRNHLAAGEPVSGRVTYVYDGSNKRVKREQGSATIQYLYDGEKVLSETYGSNNLLHQYTSTNEQYGDLIRAYNGTSASYYQFNPQFSTEALLSQSGSVTDRMRYLAFGLGTQTQGSDTFENTFVGKKGYVWDATLDLYFMGPMARPYDPVAGRFTKEDSIGGYRSGWNLYEYCANDPINNIDPSGNDLFIQGQSTANNLKANLGDSGIIIKPVDLGPLKDGESNLYYAQLDPTTRPKIDALVNNTSERFWKKVGYGLAGATTKGAYTGLVSPIPGGFEIDEFDVSQLSPNQLELIFESDLATWGKDKAFDWSLGGAAHSAVLQELEKGPDFNPGLVPIEVLGELAQRGYAARARELGNLVILADYNPLGKGLIYFILGPRFLPTCSGEGVTALNLRAFYQVLDVIPVDNATSSPKEAIAQQKTAQNDFSIIRSYFKQG